jgi:hypothetical protein
MHQLNDSGMPVGDLLNHVLRDWLDQHPETPPSDARERAHSITGMLAHLAPGEDSFKDLKEMRRLDWEDEEHFFAEHSN